MLKLFFLLFSLFSSFGFSEEKPLPQAIQETNLPDIKKTTVCGAENLEDKIRSTQTLLSGSASTAAIAKRLQALRACGVGNETKAFIVAFSYLEAIGSKKNFLEKWLLSLKQRESAASVDLLKLLIGAVDVASSESIAKIPLARIIQLRIFLVDMASKLIQRGILPSDSSVENFLSRSSFDFLLTGKGHHIEALLGVHIESYIKDKKNFLFIIENVCTHWFYIGRGHLCAKEISKIPSNLINNSNRENLTKARILFFQNKIDESIKLINENIERGLRDNSDNFLAWGYYGLSNYLPFVDRVDDGKKALLEFKKLMDIKTLGWLGAIILTREQSHSFDKGEYEKSLEFGNKAIEFLKSKVDGKTSEVAWAKYFRLMALYKLKKIKEFSLEHEELQNYISDMPSMQFLVAYGRLMGQALKVEEDTSKKATIEFNKSDPEYHRLLKALK